MSGDDDASLFRRHVAGVIPLEQDRIDPAARHRKAKTPPVETRRREHFHRAEFSEQPDSFHRGGLQRAVLRRFRRGDIRPDCRIDLHGYQRDRAQRTLEAFLDRACREGRRCALIIHGKGSRSEQRVAVLRQLVRAVLIDRPEVIGFAPARPTDGGDGAVYALLRSRRAAGSR